MPEQFANKIATLKRHYTPFGTFGELSFRDITLKTIERPWRDNKPLISCVPEGVYELDPHISSKPFIGNTWALVNHSLGVYHFDNPEAKRTAILLHIANRTTQLEGCIGVGKSFGASVDATGAYLWGVWNSTDAMAELRKAFSGQAVLLDIRSALQ